jgi:hypothetical protein
MFQIVQQFLKLVARLWCRHRFIPDNYTTFGHYTWRCGCGARRYLSVEVVDTANKKLGVIKH